MGAREITTKQGGSNHWGSPIKGVKGVSPLAQSFGFAKSNIALSVLT